MRKGTCISTAVAAVALACSCSSTTTELVNAVALTPRVSRTDERSLEAIKRSAVLRTQRRQDYRVGPEDLLEISIFEWELREETKTAVFRVAESGKISMPVIGELQVGGKTVEQIRASVEGRLRDGGFIKHPRVAVNIREYRSKRVSVVGAVEEPGAYTLRENVTSLLDAISLAGGTTDAAGQVVHVLSPQESDDPESGSPTAPSELGGVTTIDLFELMQMGHLRLNMTLRDGDVVYVPRAESYSVTGFVESPGTFKLKQPTTVLDGIARAGGVLDGKASPRHCVLRRNEGGQETLKPVDLAAIAAGRSPNLYLRPGDVLVVRQTQLARTGAAFLDVFKRIFSVGYRL